MRRTTRWSIRLPRSPTKTAAPASGPASALRAVSQVVRARAAGAPYLEIDGGYLIDLR